MTWRGLASATEDPVDELAFDDIRKNSERSPRRYIPKQQNGPSFGDMTERCLQTESVSKLSQQTDGELIQEHLWITHYEGRLCFVEDD